MAHVLHLDASPWGERSPHSSTPHPDLLDITDELWLENFEMLFLSVVRLARLVTKPMRQQGGGAIVNISACDSQEHSLGTP